MLASSVLSYPGTLAVTPDLCPLSFTSPGRAVLGTGAHVPVTPRRVRNGFAQQALAAEATYSNRVTEREHAAATLDLCTVSASAQARVTTRLQDDSEG